MNVKTIETHLERRFDGFLRSIGDEKLRERVKESAFVTGGCIVSMFLNEPVNDYDLYFDDVEVAHDLAVYLQSKLLKKYQEDMSFVVIGSTVETKNPVGSNLKVRKNSPEQYRPKYFSENAISLEGDFQVITRWCGTPHQVHSNFDFVHCTNYWVAKDGKLYTIKEALLSLLTKELRYIGYKYPICSMIRTRKFIERGWFINAGEMLKIAVQISELDLQDISTLENQLVGVDVDYFRVVIENLRNEAGSEVTEQDIHDAVDLAFN